MVRLVEFPLEGGGTILVEVDEPLASPLRGPVRGPRGAGELAVAATQTLQEAVAQIQPAAVAVLARVRDAVDPPQEVELEFGVQLSAEFGAIVAKAAGDANFRVRMRWSGDGG